GDVARILGIRWEQVGGAALVARHGDVLVPLWRDKALGRWLGTLGLPNPDAILLDRTAEPTLRPVDLKWAIDTATHTQIAGAALEELFRRAGDRLAALVPDGLDGWTFGDGLFATPVRQLNRLFLRSRANRECDRPMLREDLLEIAVDPA